MIISLETVKEHLRVDFDDEDALITAYMEAAFIHIEDYCDDDIENIAPEIVTAAALLLIGDLYQNRQAQTEKPLHDNEAVNRLLSLQRKLSI